jgi:hypothetical protein
MLIALIDNLRTEAKKGLHGICPECLQPVIAKCGQIKIHHWAHRSKGTCACWWEPETEWHRSWKKHFPVDWQEIYVKDVQKNEKHVADIKTPQGFVIEFQHSYINAEKRVSRENFYQNMIWVVDGARTDTDYFRFFLGKDYKLQKTLHTGIFHIKSPNESFSRLWTESPMTVIFDFLGAQQLNRNEPDRNLLWCLFPDRMNGAAVVAALKREDFVNITKTNSLLLISANNFINYLNNVQQKQMQAQKAEAIRAIEQQLRMKHGRHFRF